jgi:hypothetical protein
VGRAVSDPTPCLSLLSPTQPCPGSLSTSPTADATTGSQTPQQRWAQCRAELELLVAVLAGGAARLRLDGTNVRAAVLTSSLAAQPRVAAVHCRLVRLLKAAARERDERVALAAAEALLREEELSSRSAAAATAKRKKHKANQKAKHTAAMVEAEAAAASTTQHDPRSTAPPAADDTALAEALATAEALAAKEPANLHTPVRSCCSVAYPHELAVRADGCALLRRGRAGVHTLISGGGHGGRCCLDYSWCALRWARRAPRGRRDASPSQRAVSCCPPRRCRAHTRTNHRPHPTPSLRRPALQPRRRRRPAAAPSSGAWSCTGERLPLVGVHTTPLFSNARLEASGANPRETLASGRLCTTHTVVCCVSSSSSVKRGWGYGTQVGRRVPARPRWWPRARFKPTWAMPLRAPRQRRWRRRREAGKRKTQKPRGGARLHHLGALPRTSRTV